MDQLLGHVHFFFIQRWFFSQHEQYLTQTVNHLHLFRLQEVRLHPHRLKWFKQLIPKTIQRMVSRSKALFNESELREQGGPENLCFFQTMVPFLAKEFAHDIKSHTHCKNYCQGKEVQSDTKDGGPVYP